MSLFVEFAYCCCLCLCVLLLKWRSQVCFFLFGLIVHFSWRSFVRLSKWRPHFSYVIVLLSLWMLADQYDVPAGLCVMVTLMLVSLFVNVCDADCSLTSFVVRWRLWSMWHTHLVFHDFPLTVVDVRLCVEMFALVRPWLLACTYSTFVWLMIDVTYPLFFIRECSLKLVDVRLFLLRQNSLFRGFSLVLTYARL